VRRRAGRRFEEVVRGGFLGFALRVEGPCCISSVHFLFRGLWSARLMTICVRFGSLARQHPAASCYFFIVFLTLHRHTDRFGWGLGRHGTWKWVSLSRLSLLSRNTFTVLCTKYST